MSEVISQFRKRSAQILDDLNASKKEVDDVLEKFRQRKVKRDEESRLKVGFCGLNEFIKYSTSHEDLDEPSLKSSLSKSLISQDVKNIKCTGKFTSEKNKARLIFDSSGDENFLPNSEIGRISYNNNLLTNSFKNSSIKSMKCDNSHDIMIENSTLKGSNIRMKTPQRLEISTSSHSNIEKTSPSSKYTIITPTKCADDIRLFSPSLFHKDDHDGDLIAEYILNTYLESLSTVQKKKQQELMNTKISMKKKDKKKPPLTPIRSKNNNTAIIQKEESTTSKVDKRLLASPSRNKNKIVDEIEQIESKLQESVISEPSRSLMKNVEGNMKQTNKYVEDNIKAISNSNISNKNTTDHIHNDNSNNHNNTNNLNKTELDNNNDLSNFNSPLSAFIKKPTSTIPINNNNNNSSNRNSNTNNNSNSNNNDTLTLTSTDEPVNDQVQQYIELISMLKSQLISNGLKPIEEIVTLENAEQKLKVSLQRLMEGDELAEGEFSKWDEYLRNHPEFKAKEEVKKGTWIMENQAVNEHCLCRLRAIIPCNILHTTLTEIESKLPPTVSKRIWLRKALWLTRTPKEVIAKVHIADLQTKYSTQGMDEVELRAILASLPERFENDQKLTKVAWRESVLQSIQSKAKPLPECLTQVAVEAAGAENHTTSTLTCPDQISERYNTIVKYVDAMVRNAAYKSLKDAMPVGGWQGVTPFGPFDPDEIYIAPIKSTTENGDNSNGTTTTTGNGIEKTEIDEIEDDQQIFKLKPDKINTAYSTVEDEFHLSPMDRSKMLRRSQSEYHFETDYNFHESRNSIRACLDRNNSHSSNKNNNNRTSGSGSGSGSSDGKQGVSTLSSRPVPKIRIQRSASSSLSTIHEISDILSNDKSIHEVDDHEDDDDVSGSGSENDNAVGVFLDEIQQDNNDDNVNNDQKEDKIGEESKEGKDIDSEKKKCTTTKEDGEEEVKEEEAEAETGGIGVNGGGSSVQSPNSHDAATAADAAAIVVNTMGHKPPLPPPHVTSLVATAKANNHNHNRSQRKTETETKIVVPHAAEEEEVHGTNDMKGTKKRALLPTAPAPAKVGTVVKANSSGGGGGGGMSGLMAAIQQKAKERENARAIATAITATISADTTTATTTTTALSPQQVSAVTISEETTNSTVMNKPVAEKIPPRAASNPMKNPVKNSMTSFMDELKAKATARAKRSETSTSSTRDSM